MPELSEIGDSMEHVARGMRALAPASPGTEETLCRSIDVKFPLSMINFCFGTPVWFQCTLCEHTLTYGQCLAFKNWAL